MYDAFISYASEDEDTVAKPLAAALREVGLEVWFAPLRLKVGDRLRSSLDDGVVNSRYGIVVFSPAFLNISKYWTQYELDGLVQREVEGRKVVLPVWHGLDAATLRKVSPSLTDRIAVRWADGLESAVADLLSVIRPLEKSQRRFRLERRAFDRCYHFQDATVPALRLVGAATECFREDAIRIDVNTSQYLMPEPYASQRVALVAGLEEEARQKGRAVFNGPCVRMSDIVVEYPDPSTEKKRLKLVFGPLDYYDYAIMRRISDASMLDDGRDAIDLFIDLDELIGTGSPRSNKLSSIVDTATVIVTQDGHVLYANRSQQVGDRGGWYTSAVAENLHAEKDGVFASDDRYRSGAPTRTVLRGIEEELSPDLALVASRANLKPLLLGVSFDLEGFHPDLLFLWLSEQSAGEVLSLIRNRPGRDFFEGAIRALDVSQGFHAIVRALTAERWTPGGAAAVVRALEFLTSAGQKLNAPTLTATVRRLLDDGVDLLESTS